MIAMLPNSRQVLWMLVATSAFAILSLAESPPNDVCDQAISYNMATEPSTTGDFFVQMQGSTLEATDDQPDLCGDTSASKRGLWYVYQNSSIPRGSSLVVTVSTCTDITDFDTALTLYQGRCGSLQCINGVDNDPECGLGSDDIHSTISWHAETDTSYYILVHGSKRNHTGTFGIYMSHQAPLPPPPDNDGSGSSKQEPSASAGTLLKLPLALWVATIVLISERI